MKATRTMKTLLVGVGSMALVAVLLVGVRGTVAGYRGTDGAVAGMAAAECAGTCATCPLAGTEECGASAGTCTAEHSEAYVDAGKCVGCDKCVKAAPEAFELDEDSGKASIKEGASEQAIERGAEACPVGAVVK